MNSGIRLAVMLVVVGLPGAAHGRAKTNDGCVDAAPESSDLGDESVDDGSDGSEDGSDDGTSDAATSRTAAAADSAGAEAQAASSMRVAVSGKERPITAVRLHGLKALTEEKVWRLVGERPAGQISSDHATEIVSRMMASGLFASVTPTLDVVGDAAVLDISLEEYPVVSRIVIEGLTEVRAEELLEAILDGAPLEDDAVQDGDAVKSNDDGDGDDDDDDQEERAPKRDKDSRHAKREAKHSKRSEHTCAARRPTPPKSWVAHAGAAGQVAPGIVWQGLRAALDRGLQKLFDHGYAMASMEGELSTDGTLTVHVDEGHLEGLDLQGVEPAVEPEVRKILGIKPGDVFLLDDVRQGVKRVRRTLRFLEPESDGERQRSMPQIAEERLEGGRLKYRTVEGASRKARKHRGGSVEVHDRTLSWSFDKDHTGSVTLPFPISMDQPPYVHIQGRRATVRFQPRLAAADWDWAELLHHTQVQGFAPGALLSVALLDQENRGHLTLDGGLWINTARPAERIDYLVGARLSIPWLRVAEVGAQRYSLTDTDDGWRATDVSSYLGSMLFNRPDREYYRRDGFTGLVTFHFGDRLTVGAEYRNELQRSMDATATPQTLFNRSEAPWVNAPIDEGRVASAVGRLEWSSEPVLMKDIGRPLRSLEQSLSREEMDDDVTGWRTVNTVEVADERLGSDFHYTRLSSDTSYHLKTGGWGMLRARLRVAGGVGLLPVQKMESLGGWTGLRGYDFKEFQGNASVLGTAEYQWTVFSAFVDVGSVRVAGGVWSPARVGIGAAFNLGGVSLAAAWRTDDRARAAPEVRLIFQRTY
ncbi:MAG TPA: BamA/TamA family outer membrane protein [Myxococcaceae bacterium]|nr:BamA/TamA family outer membrane protein [Myxococcaceae bacterium]